MTKPGIQRRTQSAVRMVFALGALASVWNLTAAWAEASCSDYVVLGRGGGHAVQPESSPLGNPVPSCRGPDCRRGLPSPLPADLPVRTAAFDAWTGMTLLAGDVNPSSVLLEQATHRLPLAVAPRIDRPPRAIV